MSEISEFVFKEGDQAFAINFDVITCTMHPKQEGFDAKETNTDSYRSAKVYATKRDAINAVIEALESIRDCQDE